jgi:GH24 family phage-related lysozyme (muramidase)
VNAAGISLLKRWENEPLSLGLIPEDWQDGRIEATWDPIGRRYTIGYGHTGEYTAIVQGMSHAQDRVSEGDYLYGERAATELLLADIAVRERALLPRLPSTLNPNQISALTCLAYNVGVGAVLNSHLLGDIKRATRFPLGGSDVLQAIGHRWLSWDHGEVHGHEEVITGLLNRRKAEWALFVAPV